MLLQTKPIALAFPFEVQDLTEEVFPQIHKLLLDRK